MVIKSWESREKRHTSYPLLKHQLFFVCLFGDHFSLPWPWTHDILLREKVFGLFFHLKPFMEHLLCVMYARDCHTWWWKRCRPCLLGACKPGVTRTVWAWRTAVTLPCGIPQGWESQDLSPPSWEVGGGAHASTSDTSLFPKVWGRIWGRAEHLCSSPSPSSPPSVVSLPLTCFLLLHFKNSLGAHIVSLFSCSVDTFFKGPHMDFINSLFLSFLTYLFCLYFYYFLTFIYLQCVMLFLWYLRPMFDTLFLVFFSFNVCSDLRWWLFFSIIISTMSHGSDIWLKVHCFSRHLQYEFLLSSWPKSCLSVF